MNLWRSLKTKDVSLLLPILLLLITLIAGFFLARFLEGVGQRYVREHSENILQVMATGIQNELHSAQASASTMAGSPWVFPAMIDPSANNIEKANTELDRYNQSSGFSVCYLLNAQGNAIASSNRDVLDSFVGKNYAFRPYFQEAFRGGSPVYVAAGVTSHERGFYAAHPVMNKDGKIVGVAVIKKNVGTARNVLGGYPNSFFIDPDGVVFIAGSKDMVFRTLWPLTEGRVQSIKDSQQFMKVSFEPVFPHPLRDGGKIRFRGEVYESFRKPAGPPGWSLVLLASLEGVFYFVLFGWILTAFMIGLILILLIWNASQLREQMLLRASEEKYRGLFVGVRDSVMILQPPSWEVVAANPATIEMFRARNEEEFISLGPWDLSPERQPDGRTSVGKAKEIIETALLKGFNSFEWTHKRLNGEYFSATVLLTRIGLRQETLLLATVKDITQQKQAKEELARKVAELESFNRIAVGRELKMIELKEKLKALEDGEAKS